MRDADWPRLRCLVAVLTLGTLAFGAATSELEAQVRSPASSVSRRAVQLERVTDVPCTMPGPGWSNLFFAGDTAAAERLAPFTDDAAAMRVNVVERRGAD